MLSFFQAFRKVYVGEQAMHSSKVYQQLSEHAGLHDHLSVLNACVAKVSANLGAYARCEDVVESSLQLLSDLAAGYMSGKLLLRLEAIAYTLQNHTAEHFAFLREPSNARARTAFYATLGRLLFMEDSATKFRAFMQPFDQICSQLLAAAASPPGLRAPQMQTLLSGLFRDLRGIVSATASRRTYSMLFDWIYPTHTPLLMAAMEACADVPEVAVPLLKLLGELVHNKTQRITFDASSVNGILLFRELSRLVVCHGARSLAAPVHPSDPYAYKYKGIAAAHTALQRSLTGNYVNFGVFDLYRDGVLTESIECALACSVSIPLPDLLAYRKVAKAYYSLLEARGRTPPALGAWVARLDPVCGSSALPHLLQAICHGHLKAVAVADSRTFAYVASSLESGLKSLDVAISSQ